MNALSETNCPFRILNWQIMFENDEHLIVFPRSFKEEMVIFIKVKPELGFTLAKIMPVV